MPTKFTFRKPDGQLYTVTARSIIPYEIGFWLENVEDDSNGVGKCRALLVSRDWKIIKIEEVKKHGN